MCHAPYHDGYTVWTQDSRDLSSQGFICAMGCICTTGLEQLWSCGTKPMALGHTKNCVPNPQCYTYRMMSGANQEACFLAQQKLRMPLVRTR